MRVGLVTGDVERVDIIWYGRADQSFNMRKRVVVRREFRVDVSIVLLDGVVDCVDVRKVLLIRQNDRAIGSDDIMIQDGGRTRIGGRRKLKQIHDGHRYG